MTEPMASRAIRSRKSWYLKQKHDDASSVLVDQPAPKRLQLTQKNLQKHCKGLEDMGRTRKSPSCSTVTTSDKQFGPKLNSNGVFYEDFETKAPKDAKSLRAELLKEDNDTPVSTHKTWQKIMLFKKEGGGGELSLESMIVESMLIHHDKFAPIAYSRFRNEQWTEVENEITAGMSDPKPDIMESYYWSAYPSRARDDFGELVITQYAHAMPTFVIESKGPSGNHEQAVKQAAYDGALMTHAALAIDGHMKRGREIQFEMTKAITATLSSTHIHIYANHAVEEKFKSSPIRGSRRVYHQYKLLSVEYIKSEEEWNRAHVVVFNAQRIGLRLAESRIHDLERYYETKELQDGKLKAKQARLQANARTKAKQAVVSCTSKREFRASVKPNLSRDRTIAKTGQTSAKQVLDD